MSRCFVAFLLASVQVHVRGDVSLRGAEAKPAEEMTKQSEEMTNHAEAMKGTEPLHGRGDGSLHGAEAKPAEEMTNQTEEMTNQTEVMKAGPDASAMNEGSEPSSEGMGGDSVDPENVDVVASSQEGKSVAMEAAVSVSAMAEGGRCGWYLCRRGEVCCLSGYRGHFHCEVPKGKACSRR